MFQAELAPRLRNMKLGGMLDQIPQQAQAGLTGGAVAGAWLSLVDVIQGYAALAASILSIIWLGLQIWSWWEKRRK